MALALQEETRNWAAPRAAGALTKEELVSRHRISWFAPIAALIVSVGACTGSDGADGTNGTNGTDGTDGTDGTSCTVTDNGDGTKTITCDDGTSVTVTDGADGTCTVVDNGDGTKTITCDDGTSVTVDDGQPGLGAGETPGLVATVTTSTPAAGTHFAAGEQIVIAIELTDFAGRPITLDDLSTAALYMNGPRDPLANVTPSALLNANTDRAVRPHHYIDLKAADLAGLVVTGNRLEYTTQAISTEAAGTYTIGFRGLSADYAFDRVFELADVQIGTATVEPEIVDGCADCHEGAMSGQMYMHHVDPGHSPTGSPEIDAVPISTCRMCHNQDGYASVRKCDDGSKPARQGSAYICDDGTENWSYVPDAIIRRVHGVHMGEHLLSEFNATDFEMYEGLVFPANPKNCQKCHTDDSWKNEPSRYACGACHDNLDFATGEYVPFKTAGMSTCTVDSDCTGVFNGFNGKCNATTGDCELRTHLGGAATTDTNCAACHGPSASVAPVETVHAIPAPSFAYTISIDMDAPANGQFYVAGETPTVTIVLDDGTGPIDHLNDLTNANFNRAYMYVSGPRSGRLPALTSAARGEATTGSAAPWDVSDTPSPTLDLTIGWTTLSLDPSKAPAGTFADANAATADEVAAWLNGDPDFSALAYAVSDGADVTLLVKPSTNVSGLTINSSGLLGTALGFVQDSMFTGATTGSYPNNVFYRHNGDPGADDPRFQWSTGSVKYQLDDVGSVPPGTYVVFVEAGSFAATPMSWAVKTFQVGTATEESKIATNCVDCHEDERMHASFFAVSFDPDICGSCHDNRRQVVDRLASDPADGWGAFAASGRSNFGFGAAPLSRRVHGVHRGKYLAEPREVHGSIDYSEVVFPQDIRNCGKCHSDSSSWMQKPSRLICLSCHDSDAAKAHGQLMTFDPTPEDPWNGDEGESCLTCHGPDRDFAPAEVHNIWDPYVPPYER